MINCSIYKKKIVYKKDIFFNNNKLKDFNTNVFNFFKGIFIIEIKLVKNK